jgi:tetratricopeptide (TPR) repeat protein
MDALKKAEQDKKEAAKRLKEAQDQTGEELELTDSGLIELTVSPEEKTRIEQTEETAGAEISDEGSGSLSLEASQPVEDSDLKSNLEASEAVNNGAEDITIEHPKLSVPKISVPELSIAEEVKEPHKTEKSAQDPDQTIALTNLGIEESQEAEVSPGAEVSFQDTVQTDKPDEFFDTISESRTITSVVSAAELVRDMGSGKDQPTPVAAQTVFTAVGSGSEKEYYKWVVFLILCIVVATSLSVIYYFKIVPANIESSSPLVAKGIETDPGLLSAVEIPEEILQGAIISEMANEEIQSESDSMEALSGMEADIVVDEGIKEDVVIESDLPATTVEEESSISIAGITPEEVAEITPIVTGKEMSAISENQMLPQNIEVEPAAIKISRSKVKDKHDEIINTAYAEYIKGNYSIAETSYQKVLDTKPNNRDALLGLAAIAYIKGDIQSSYAYYYSVLKLYPRDSIARTALINMQSGNNSEQSESDIKLMLQQSPEAAFLYFALGNIYATQSRWADAQQAFFDAYRFESSNPDYAFNLAVSLERVGQVKTALDYYNVALQLADNTNVNFNTASVLTRIDALSAIRHSN